MADKLSFEDHPEEEASLVVNRGTPVEDKAPEKAVLPKTEAERWSHHLETVVSKEDDDTRSTRRHKELNALLDTHLANVAKSHEMYPVRRVPYKTLTQQEQKNWNEKRRDIDMANRAYHLAVRRTCAAHVAEDAHLAKLRAKATH
jgi:hypothetical protein